MSPRKANDWSEQVLHPIKLTEGNNEKYLKLVKRIGVILPRIMLNCMFL